MRAAVSPATGGCFAVVGRLRRCCCSYGLPVAGHARVGAGWSPRSRPPRLLQLSNIAWRGAPLCFPAASSSRPARAAAPLFQLLSSTSSSSTTTSSSLISLLLLLSLISAFSREGSRYMEHNQNTSPCRLGARCLRQPLCRPRAPRLSLSALSLSRPRRMIG
ncbi:hypothetical protein VPH35_113686 [Triticum aestivum]